MSHHSDISEAFLPRPHWSLDNTDIFNPCGHNFRGFFASAPLKWQCQGELQLTLPHFRGFFASAPLKLALAIICDSSCMLISEAFLPRPHWSNVSLKTLKNSLVNFRGFFASAPLKLSQCLMLMLMVIPFPRLFCLGPIEVILMVIFTTMAITFPRLFCLGPIEVYRYWESSYNTIWFPRLFCLGPIEVLSRHLALLSYYQISEAFLPRPHWSAYLPWCSIYQSVFPRLFCLGPIEVVVHYTWYLHMVWFPRLFCLGPIEVQVEYRITIVGVKISEAFLPRPHWSYW